MKGASISQHEFVVNSPPVFAVDVAMHRQRVVTAEQRRPGVLGGRTQDDEHRLRIARQDFESMGFDPYVSARSNDITIRDPDAVFIRMCNSVDVFDASFDAALDDTTNPE